MGVGCYLPMFALHVFGEKPISISAAGTTNQQGNCSQPFRSQCSTIQTVSGTDDTAGVTMIFPGNRIAHLLYTGSNDIPTGATVYGSNNKQLKVLFVNIPVWPCSQ